MTRIIFLFFSFSLFSQTGAHAAEPYKAPFWLPGGHLQTIFTSLFPKGSEVKYRRERWELKDGDFIDADWADATSATSIEPDYNEQTISNHSNATRNSEPKKPILVIFHGLEGNSQSQYAKSLISAAVAKGWHGVVINFRGCSGEPNRLPRVYYAGDTLEIDTMLSRVRSIYPENPIYAVGYSLGGNALLKWLGEASNQSTVNISRAVAISAPIDLKASADALDTGMNRIFYTPIFVDSIRAKALVLSKRFPGVLDDKLIGNAKTIHDIDNAVTSVLYGADDAIDYYNKNASKPYLQNIVLPTLIINAKNDPFMPAKFLPSTAEVSKFVTLDYQEEGGHVGFFSTRFSDANSWLPSRIIEFLEEH